jgi:hypothetical protein
MPSHRTFRAGSDRLFESILDISLIVEAFFCHLIACSNQPPIKPGDGIALQSLRSSEIIATPVALDFFSLAMGRLPTEISIKFVPLPMDHGATPLGSSPGTPNRLLAALVSPIFLRFY